MDKQEPFELGLPDEKWYRELNALAVPVPGYIDKYFLVSRTQKGFDIIGLTRLHAAEDLLMTAAMVQHMIDNYHRGNDEDATAKAMVGPTTGSPQGPRGTAG